MRHGEKVYARCGEGTKGPSHSWLLGSTLGGRSRREKAKEDVRILRELG